MLPPPSTLALPHGSFSLVSLVSLVSLAQRMVEVVDAVDVVLPIGAEANHDETQEYCQQDHRQEANCAVHADIGGGGGP